MKARTYLIGLLLVSGQALSMNCLNDMKRQFFSKIEAAVGDECRSLTNKRLSKNRRATLRSALEKTWSPEHTLDCMKHCGTNEQCVSEHIEQFAEEAKQPILENMTKEWCLSDS